ncbi:MAG TPA: formimidoylglutamase [Phycisphaerales bacterium]|nr:formimidoylglutamase [Phycisphaerales bacterium]
MLPIPHTQPAVWPQGMPTSRLAAHFHSVPAGCRVALIGLPDDEGVRLNNGRPGAAGGPRAVRQALAAYGVAEPDGFRWPGVFDAGDVTPGKDIHETHQRVTEATAAILAHKLLPIAIGGGHDLTFPFVRAVIEHEKKGTEGKVPPMAGVYFDAHLDVRDTVGSGMPFRSLVEQCGVRELHVFGLSPFANTREHVEWFKAHGGRIHSHKAHQQQGGPMHMPALGNCFVSFDVDVLDSSCAPGVSAMNPSGWSVAQAEAWVYGAGRSERVRCFDIMELNPAVDETGRTARVAAHLLLTFLRGFAERH